MIAKDGLRGLYRGVSAPLVGVAPIFALSFAGNNAGQQMVRSATGHAKLNYGEYFCAGMIAGVYSTVIMAPGERIKVRFYGSKFYLKKLQVPPPNRFNGQVQGHGRLCQAVVSRGRPAQCLQGHRSNSHARCASQWLLFRHL